MEKEQLFWEQINEKYFGTIEKTMNEMGCSQTMNEQNEKSWTRPSLATGVFSAFNSTKEY